MPNNPIPVLIVDDDPTVGAVLQGLLRNLGDGVVCAPKWVGSGKEALAMVRQSQWPLMLLDYQLSDADGLTVLDELNKLPEGDRPAVVMLTGSGNERVAVEAMKRGAKDYLVKAGVHLPELRRAIVSALERRRLEDRLAESTAELRRKNAQLEADLAMACRVQRALLPVQYPTVPAGVPPERSMLRFCHRWIPSSAVAGDFFAVLPVSHTSAAVLLCDVMGHGVRAALVAALIHGLARECRALAGSPERFLTEINRGLQSLLAQTDDLVFVTAVYLVIDVARGELRLANAGHPQPLLLRHEGELEMVAVGVDGSGPALGMIPDENYAAVTVPLSPGDRVFVFTDGLYEAADASGEEFGTARLRVALTARAGQATPSLLDGLLDAVRAFGSSASGQGFADDLCLVAVDFALRNAG
jgi:sigma-B regulation protein RsbU (phosphoserine phosphatase)